MLCDLQMPLLWYDYSFVSLPSSDHESTAGGGSAVLLEQVGMAQFESCAIKAAGNDGLPAYHTILPCQHIRASFYHLSFQVVFDSGLTSASRLRSSRSSFTLASISLMDIALLLSLIPQFE